MQGSSSGYQSDTPLTVSRPQGGLKLQSAALRLGQPMNERVSPVITLRSMMWRAMSG